MMLTESIRPLLSICIPTYNRAALLKSALAALTPQVVALGSKVELLVSDNCSPDGTKEVVECAQRSCPIRYRRNEENFGGLYNFVNTASEFARGDFSWILGDDDLIRPGAVAKVISIIERFPSLPYIFVNHSYENAESRRRFANLGSGEDYSEVRSLLCDNTDEFLVEKWEDIIYQGEVPALFTSIVSHVVRRNIWIEGSRTLRTLHPKEVLGYEDFFAHLHILARALTGKQVYYLGFPYVILFVGDQEWLGSWPRLLFALVPRFPDELEKLGADPRVAQHYRNVLFRESVRQFRELVFQKRQSLEIVSGFRVRDGEDWSLCKAVVRHWRNKEFARLLYRASRDEARTRMFKAKRVVFDGLKGIWRRLKGGVKCA